MVAETVKIATHLNARLATDACITLSRFVESSA